MHLTMAGRAAAASMLVDRIAPTARLARSMRMLALAALGSLAGLPAAAQAPTRIDVQGPAANDNLPDWVAMEKGFFARRGIDASFEIAANPGALPAALVAGTLQYGVITAPQIALANEAGLDLVIVSGGMRDSRSHPHVAVVARPGANIHAPADFKGKRVAAPSINAVLDVMFKKWLLDRGVDPKTVTFVELGFAQMPDALKSGVIDAALVVEPFRSRMVAEGGVNVADYFSQVRDNSLLAFKAATRKWAEQHRDAVRGFREAVKEGYAYMQAHVGEAKAIEAKYLRLPPPVIEHLPLPDNLEIDVEPASIQFWLDLCKELGITRTSADAAKIIMR
jgi:NitT/TauT family transport system substrate-binding protein